MTVQISVVDPISKAIDRTRKILFQPFAMKKWFVLGFCAFLAQLSEGGGTPQFNFSGGGRGGVRPMLQSTTSWVQANASVAIVGGLVGLAVLIGLLALLCWLGSRGQFMFIDGLVHNRAAVKLPWRIYEDHGNNLMVYRLLINVAGIMIIIMSAVVSASIAWTDLQTGQMGNSTTLALLVGFALLIPCWIVWSVVSMIVNNFVVPAMYLHNQKFVEAWSTAWHHVIVGHGKTITLYFLMKFALGMGIGVIAAVATCLTCCLTGIPYIGTVILLPLFVFERCYSLYFLEQYGYQWWFFVREGWPPRCEQCGYDLRYNTSGRCPECGTPIPPEVMQRMVPPAEPAK